MSRQAERYLTCLSCLTNELTVRTVNSPIDHLLPLRRWDGPNASASPDLTPRQGPEP